MSGLVLAGELRSLVTATADSDVTENRLRQLLEHAEIATWVESVDTRLLADFVTLVSVSAVFFRFLCRHPQHVHEFGTAYEFGRNHTDAVTDLDSLRQVKYAQLLKIIGMDFSATFDYQVILSALSELAEQIINAAARIIMTKDEFASFDRCLCIIAMGKLGARELNFSSDIDLVFVTSNEVSSAACDADLHNRLSKIVRRLARALEEATAEGFLYRVDLNLRPWGRSAPLFLCVDDTEHYYEASSDSWERFAWLRARVIAGASAVGNDILDRLQPFIFRRSLSTEDLDRFIDIKNEIARVRRQRGHWNVKLGEGGIRDIEFFIQVLQIVNAATNDALRTTNTTEILAGLCSRGLISEQEFLEIKTSYLFLRRLENHLQLAEEKQVHQLPDVEQERLLLAKSMGIDGESNDEILEQFENQLFVHKSIARRYFERTLPDEPAC